MPEFRITVPTTGVAAYEVGQVISIYVGDADEEFREPEMHIPARIIELVDIGIRTGLVLEVPKDFSERGLYDNWIESMREHL